MTTAAHIARALGGDETLDVPVHTTEQLRTTILKGLPFGALEAVRANFGLARPLLVRVLRVPERTLLRRKKGDRFRVEESDRLVRLARIAAVAEDVLGSREKAGRWLQKPNRALGGAVPLEHLDTEPGSRQVEDVLRRIAHGVVG